MWASTPVVLRVGFLGQQHWHQLELIRCRFSGTPTPAPRPTEAGSLWWGPAICVFSALQGILVLAQG